MRRHRLAAIAATIPFSVGLALVPIEAQAMTVVRDSICTISTDPAAAGLGFSYPILNLGPGEGVAMRITAIDAAGRSLGYAEYYTDGSLSQWLYRNPEVLGGQWTAGPDRNNPDRPALVFPGYGVIAAGQIELYPFAVGTEAPGAYREVRWTINVADNSYWCRSG